MGIVDPVKITGLRDFQAALKEMDGETQKQLRVVLNEAADQVAVAARRRVPSKSGRARASIKVASSQREAAIKGGSTKAPYYPWLDFGGRVGKKRSVNRSVIAGGRYMYPAFSARRRHIEEVLEQELIRLAERAGLEVS